MKALKIIGLTFLVLLLIVAAAGLYLWNTASTQAERYAIRYLEGMGIAPVKIEIADFGGHSVAVRHVSVGDPELFVLEGISFPYEPSVAFKGRIGAVHVREASLYFPVKDGVLSLGLFDTWKPPASGSAAFDPAVIPTNSLKIDTLNIVLKSDQGDRTFLVRNVTITQQAGDPSQFALGAESIEDRTSPPVIAIPIRLSATLDMKPPMHWKGTFQGMGKQLTLNFYGKGDKDFIANTYARLDIRSMPIQTPIALLMNDGVSVSGEFSGSLPLTFKNNHVAIDDAKFTAKDKGVIQYMGQGGALGGDSRQAALVSAALRNFHYDVLSFSVDTLTPERTEVRAAIQGRNPDLYEGKPINLNIVIGGDIEGIVKNTMTVYGLPKQIEHRIGEK